MRAARKNQAELFSRIQPRFVHPEKPRFYDAVLFLRSRGLAVLRVSNQQSSLDGRLLDNKQVIQIAVTSGLGT